jgi:UDP-2-acetamido-3-amino-2,3-dideoxy-glucuronate N-acetyltransferase
MILSLAGETPETISATGGNYLHRKIADVTTTHLRFPSGLRAHVFVSWLHPFKEQKLVVVGDRKMAVFDDTRPWDDKLLLYPHEIRWQGTLPVPAKKDPERVVVPQDEPLKLECLHFLECVQNGKRPLTDGEEGLRVLRVLNTAQASMDRLGSEIAFEGPGAAFPGANGKTSLAPAEKQEGAFSVHPSAVVDDDVSIGKGSKIWHFSHVLSRSRLGDGCNVGQNVVIGPDVQIGNRCKIQNNVSVYKGVTLEDGVFCGPSMVFTNIYNPRAEISKMDQVRPTLVRKGATIGANATIVCGVTVGRYAFVGAGAVVTKDVADHALVVGNPARQIGWVCECGEPVKEKGACKDCKKKE